MKHACSLAALLLLASPALVLAADAETQAGRQCAQVKDSLQRLVCYDRVFQAGDPAPPAPPAPPAAARARPATPLPATTPAAAPATASLGDETLRRSRKEKDADKPAEPSNLEARVTALKETRPLTFRVTLDNGQIWQQMDMSSTFYLEAGDAIRIEKGTMGGYRMARVSKGRSPWVRVVRVE